MSEMTLKSGNGPIKANRDALSSVRHVYTGDSSLRSALQGHRIPTASLDGAFTIVSSYLRGDLVLGVSGFATAGIRCNPETEVLEALYQHLLQKRRCRPDLVVDGGVHGGVLGANGKLAHRFGIPSLGYVPYKGLAEAGARTYLVVNEQTFRAREKYVGTTPDLLLCLGGGDGTGRECITAIKRGVLAMIVAPQDYHNPKLFPNTYLDFEVLRRAIKTGQLVFCGPQDNPGDKLDELLARLNTASRPLRLRALESWLHD